MIWVIASKEIRESFHSLRFAMALLMVGVLGSVTGHQLVAAHHEAQAAYAADMAASAESLRSMNQVEQMQNIGLSVNRRPEVLKVLCHGMDEAIPRSVTVGTWVPMQTSTGLLQDQPLERMLGQVDGTYFVLVVLSVVALLLSYDAICGEGEQGTLRLMLVGSVARDQVVIGKLLGRLCVLLCPFGCFVLVLLAFLSVLPDAHLGSEEVARLLVWSFVSLLYLSSLLAMGVLVSVHVRNSFESILLLLLAWSVLVWGVPRASGMASMGRVSTLGELASDRDEWMQAQIEQAARAVGMDPSRPSNDQPAEARQQLQNRLEALKGALRQYDWDQTETFLADIGQRLRLLQRLTGWSPATAYFFASSALARTAWEDEVGFLRALTIYHRSVNAFSQRKKEERNEIGRAHGFDLDVMDAFDFKTGMPAFAYPTRSLAQACEDLLLHVLVLVLWNVVLFLATYVSFLRRDV
ncbi:MAG: ABC transporter permease subunit [Candidatus Latescibacterota bacterium]|jgi:ABC-type transport system involved in multi-copper enzyme maturation permease subunit